MNPVGLGSGADLVSMATQGGTAAASPAAGMSVLKKALDSSAAEGQMLADQMTQIGRLSVYA